MVSFCVVLVRRCFCCACCTNSLTMEHCMAVARNEGIRITIKFNFIFLDVLISIHRRRIYEWKKNFCSSIFLLLSYKYELHFIKLPVMVFDNEISTHTHTQIVSLFSMSASFLNFTHCSVCTIFLVVHVLDFNNRSY
jgi:hypothetical protein